MHRWAVTGPWPLADIYGRQDVPRRLQSPDTAPLAAPLQWESGTRPLTNHSIPQDGLDLVELRGGPAPGRGLPADPPSALNPFCDPNSLALQTTSRVDVAQTKGPSTPSHIIISQQAVCRSESLESASSG
ncbi:hypothetical protein CORC01_07287 [Colletotrichum orchidophilum]|uniref:Uncharacterized protein n=1 Tax=Colletotrichum orchidophilum TaxID=1209926 RepID=A0A1G4B7X6_9PEZI|nr:uncharacterized protein CORC01_07287 [Colletotrichum orchidophilum]OHE97382.1 hypothetical protein CORC01_07287 [Colletotrichum orchidophilum]